MLKTFLAGLLILLIFSPAQAAFHNMYLDANQKDLNYFLLPHLSGGSLASSFNFDIATDKDRSAELFLLGQNSPMAYSASSNNLLGLLFKQKLFSAGNLKFSGMIGLGALYTSVSGTSFAPSLGGSLGYAFSPQLKLSVPMVISIFKDGALLDYSGGISYALPGFPGKEVVIGAKGLMMTILTTNLMAFQNTTYSMIGLRAYL
ncbi:MAG: hypothetical protein WC645_05770 [Candidatus Margulisiibacteriota bacterium]